MPSIPVQRTVNVQAAVSTGITAPVMQWNINNDVLWSGHNGVAHMEYSQAHTHTNGRCIEFNYAQHDRPPGVTTGIRWTDFTASGAPTFGRYWSDADFQIAGTDNRASHYMPWLDGVYELNTKIINSMTATPQGDPYYRNPTQGSPPNESSIWGGTYVLWENPNGADKEQFYNNFNAGCLVNTTGNFSVSFGGGDGNNFPGGFSNSFTVIDQNPAYPGQSHLLRARTYLSPNNTSPQNYQPMMHRMVSKVGDWVYWGNLVYVRHPTNNIKLNGWFRVSLSSMNLGGWYQQVLPDAPLAAAITPSVVTANGLYRHNCVLADEPRKRLITITADGVCVYQIPADDGTAGTWYGPFRDGAADWVGWAKVKVSPEWDSAGLNRWVGVLGIHRTDLGPFGQTFFRSNYSRRWNRIIWQN